jgi:hypothetical protein
MSEQDQNPTPIQRNPNGTYAKGQSGNPKGRASKAREAALLAIGQEIINAQTWRAIVNKAALDALGKTIVNGQAADDPDSTANGRNVARIWIRDTFIGKPTEYIATDLADSPFEQLGAYSNDDIAAAIALLEQVQHRDDVSDSADGIAETGGA